MSEKKYYNQIKKITTDQGTYNPADDTTISHAAAVLAQIDIARAVLNTEGQIQEFQTGAKQISPELNAWRGLLQDFAKYADVLALTPKSRKRLAVEVKKRETKPNPFQLKKVK